MRISALSERTGVPIGTIKYYLREGLLASGERTSRTTAEYDESHVERLRLVRALTDPGGLGIAAVRRIVDVLDTPDPARLDLLATAQDALLHEDALRAGEVPAPEHGAAHGEGPAPERDRTCEEGAIAEGDPSAEESRARTWLARRGWWTAPEDPLGARLERVWAAAEQAGVSVDDELMDGYAAAMEEVARLDVDAVPTEAEGAVRRVVVGTVMLEPVLLTLRMLAQREVSVRRARGERAEGGAGAE
jgi:DNA-binding transcriptional MerR regulator